MRRRLAGFALIAIGWSAPLAAEPTHGSMINALLDGVIIPAYERYEQSMTALHPAISDLCADPNQASLDKSRQAFAKAMDDWQRLQPLTFGPIHHQSLTARIQFWPDKHGTAGKQIAKAMAKQDPALLKNGVAGKSVALQSLSALERVLYDHGEDLKAGNSFVCSLADAIALYQQGLAASILEDWRQAGGFQDHLIAVARGGADRFEPADATSYQLYYDAEDAASDMLQAMANALDSIVVNKIERPLGDSLEKARPKRAESWRSARSMANIIANLEMVQQLYLEPGGFGAWLPAADQLGFDQRLRASLDSALSLARSIDPTLAEAVEDPKAHDQVDRLRREVKALAIMLVDKVGNAANLSLGFNTSDGD